MNSSNDAYAWTAHHNQSLDYTVNGLNQLTAVDTTAFTHDGRGNLTSDGHSSYGYDVENRLTSVTGANALALSYDPLERLCQLSGGVTVTTQFLHDGDALVAEYSSSGTLLRCHVHGATVDEVLVWV